VPHQLFDIFDGGLERDFDDLVTAKVPAARLDRVESLG
jgi:hypothetical protein